MPNLRNRTAPYLFLLFLFTLFASPVDAAKMPPKYAAIVIHADTGEVLESEDPDRITHPASLTKMMTLYMIFSAIKAGRLSMDTEVTASAHAAKQAPSKLGLRPGEKIAVKNIVMALVTKSANDAAAAIAEHLGENEEAFARMMTRKARLLGMHHTTFKNASGLPNLDQVTTARDMATLARALYRDFPEDYNHFKLTSFRHKGCVHHNHNHLLGKVHGLDGIKTGFINASGFNLAASAQRLDDEGNPKRLITVVMGGPNRHWRDNRVVELLEANFERLGVRSYKPEKSSKSVWETPSKKDNALDALVQDVAYKKQTTDPATWVVQVGAYPSQKTAKKRAETVKATLKEGTVTAPKVKTGSRVMYRAQITGLSRGAAKQACKSSNKKGINCSIIPAKAEKSLHPRKKMKKRVKRL